MNPLLPLSALLLLLGITGCATSPGSTAPTQSYDPADCAGDVRGGLEFQSDTAATRRFFSAFVSDGISGTGDSLQTYFELLGENVSSAILIMQEPYANQISLRLNGEMESFVKAYNRRVFVGRSPVELGDVTEMRREGEFIRVTFNSPDIVSGTVYVLCQPIEGRTAAEQTFVDYVREGETPRKLSISALMGLLR